MLPQTHALDNVSTGSGFVAAKQDWKVQTRQKYVAKERRSISKMLATALAALAKSPQHSIVHLSHHEGSYAIWAEELLALKSVVRVFCVELYYSVCMQIAAVRCRRACAFHLRNGNTMQCGAPA